MSSFLKRSKAKLEKIKNKIDKSRKQSSVSETGPEDPSENEGEFHSIENFGNDGGQVGKFTLVDKHDLNKFKVED